ncbi:bile acid:sodium symporter [soil metagenome]
MKTPDLPNQKQTPANRPVTNPQRVQELLARAGLDWFLLALIGMIGLAYLWPTPGIQEGPLSLKGLANYGVSLIFFFYGLRLSPEKLRAGLGNWRLHLVIQFSTFLLFPLLVLPWRGLVAGQNSELLWLGTFYLAALPSTVSSSVVMVGIAGGNLPGAIFNASISSLAGIFLTPLWMGLFLTASSEGFDLGQVMGKLVVQVLVPVVGGILLHRYWGAFAERHRTRLRVFDQSIILLIVYTSFADSFAREMFRGFSLLHLVGLSALMVVFFFLVYGIIHGVSRLLGFNREDRITALFCGSKKSLVHGTVMSKVLFPDANVVGIILLPIMLYHALQLLTVSAIAQAMARRAKGE